MGRMHECSTLDRQGRRSDLQRNDDIDWSPGTLATLPSADCDNTFALGSVASTRRFPRGICSLGVSFPEVSSPPTVGANRIWRRLRSVLPCHPTGALPRSRGSIHEQVSACAIGCSRRALKAGQGSDWRRGRCGAAPKKDERDDVGCASKGHAERLSSLRRIMNRFWAAALRSTFFVQYCNLGCKSGLISEWTVHQFT
jgi:hypothetical protein